MEKHERVSLFCLIGISSAAWQHSASKLACRAGVLLSTRWNPFRPPSWFNRVTQGVGLRRIGERGEGAGGGTNPTWFPGPYEIGTNQNGGWNKRMNLSVAHQKRLFCRLQRSSNPPTRVKQEGSHSYCIYTTDKRCWARQETARVSHLVVDYRWVESHTWYEYRESHARTHSHAGAKGLGEVETGFGNFACEHWWCWRSDSAISRQLDQKSAVITLAVHSYVNCEQAFLRRSTIEENELVTL